MAIHNKEHKLHRVTYKVHKATNNKVATTNNTAKERDFDFRVVTLLKMSSS